MIAESQVRLNFIALGTSRAPIHVHNPRIQYRFLRLSSQGINGTSEEIARSRKFGDREGIWYVDVDVLRRPARSSDRGSYCADCHRFESEWPCNSSALMTIEERKCSG